MARQPRNGLGSVGKPPTGSLSPPMSKVRMTTGWPAKASMTRSVTPVLLLLVGHGRAADDEEFGAHEPHAFGAAAARRLRLLGQVDVGAQRDVHAVGGDRSRPRRAGSSSASRRFVAGALGGTPRSRRRSGSTTSTPWCRRGSPARRPCSATGGVAQADHRRQAERAREDGDVRGARAGVGGDAAMASRSSWTVRLGVRSCVTRIAFAALGSRPGRGRGVRAGCESTRMWTSVRSLTRSRSIAMRVAREVLAPLQHHEVERLLGREVLPDERPRRAASSSASSRIESWASKIAASSRPACGSALARTCGRRSIARSIAAWKRCEFRGHPVFVDDAVRDVGHLPPQQMHRADDDAGRGRDSGEDASPWGYCSPNLLAISAARASTAACASAPSARSVPASRIRRPAS